MHLGLLVVYLVKPENEKLLELHLRQIRTLTGTPYTIYAGVSKQSPAGLEQLRREPHLKMIPLPETGLRGSAQHSFYLEHLIETALPDDITHLIILHVDSFPVRPDWVETITGKLTGNCVLSTISHGHYLALYTSCLCFRKDFYLKYRPPFLLTETNLASENYQRFSREHPHYAVDSGVGFVFKAFCESLTWTGLERSNAREDHGWYGSIYADCIFHLVGAYRHRKSSERDETLKLHLLYRLFFVTLNGLRTVLKKNVPEKIWEPVRRLGFPLMLARTSRSYDKVLSQLLNDPDGYLKSLRSGK